MYLFYKIRAKLQCFIACAGLKSQNFSPAADSESENFRLRWAQKAIFSPAASSKGNIFCLWRAEEPKLFACDGLKRFYFLPAARSESKLFRLWRVQKAIFFACGGSKSKIFRLRRAQRHRHGSEFVLAPKVSFLKLPKKCRFPSFLPKVSFFQAYFYYISESVVFKGVVVEKVSKSVASRNFKMRKVSLRDTFKCLKCRFATLFQVQKCRFEHKF